MPDIAYVSVVRNDDDIVVNNIIYYYNIGIRNFYLLLHKANTQQKMRMIHYLPARMRDCKFIITGHDKDVHYHDKDIKILTDYAMKDGFKWIIASDADELIRLQRHKTIQELIEPYDHLESVSLLCQWFEHKPLRNVYPPENAFTVFNQRKTGCNEQTKAIGKFTENMWYCPGVHLIHEAENEIHIPFYDAYYSHFPDRNIDQFTQKYNIQRENWLERYGSFSYDDEMKNDPDFLTKHWEKQIKEGNEQFRKVPDQIDERMFIYEEI